MLAYKAIQHILPPVARKYYKGYSSCLKVESTATVAKVLYSLARYNSVRVYILIRGNHLIMKNVIYKTKHKSMFAIVSV